MKDYNKDIPLNLFLRHGTTFSLAFLLLSSFCNCASVFLESITLYEKHGWWWDPSVYFYCNGENKTFLPDVHKLNRFYNFSGDESWQPLVELDANKCKRCGFYEARYVFGDSKFDEWELCPLSFEAPPDGHYFHFSPKVLNASFVCQDCNPQSQNHYNSSFYHNGNPNDGLNPRVIWFQSKINIVIFVASLVSLSLTVMGLLYFWKVKNWWPFKRHSRCEDTVRFMQLFDEDDELEDELGAKL